MDLSGFVALDDFNESLIELNTLIKLSEIYKKLNKTDRRTLMLKSTILFLGTSLECFFESIAEEYLFKLVQLGLPRNNLPDNLLLSSVNYLFNEQLVSNVKNKKPECKDKLIDIANILACESPITELKIDTRFSYGKHGSNELVKLFERLDLYNIFDHCKVVIEEETMLSDDLVEKDVNIKGKFDSLTGVRNAIIHQNTMPSTATVEGIINDIELYKVFAVNIANYMDRNIESIKNNAA